MIRRLQLDWPAGLPRGESEPKPLRLLAVSDEPDRGLSFERNRSEIGTLDAVIGCGDLEPDYLAFLGDAFCVPLLYVRGNHDRGVNWQETSTDLPAPLTGRREKLNGTSLIGLSWPGSEGGRDSRALRDDMAAWRQALRIGLRPRRNRPLIVVSHVPPLGLGDSPEDAYHRGFAAYQWLCHRLNPMLWLHGHTSLAAARGWRVQWGETTFANVTGAVLVEIGMPADGPLPSAERGD